MRVERDLEGGLLLVEGEEFGWRCCVLDVNVDVSREVDTGVGRDCAPRCGVEIRAVEGEGEAPEISGGPHYCFPGFDRDARRRDIKLLHQLFHFLEGGGGASIRSRGLSAMRSLTLSRIDANREKLILDRQGFRVVRTLWC